MIFHDESGCIVDFLLSLLLNKVSTKKANKVNFFDKGDDDV